MDVDTVKTLAVGRDIAKLGELMTDWFGFSSGGLPSPSCAIPHSLQVFYDTIGPWQSRICAQNRLISPGELSSNSDGYVTFCVESQQTVFWATKAGTEKVFRSSTGYFSTSAMYL